MNPAFATVAEFGAAYRAGVLTAEAMVTRCLARIASHDPTLNAFLHVAAESAFAEARARDVELRAGLDRGPLHGVPVAIKDIIDVAGQPTTCGSGAPDPLPAAADATLVARLRAAGAVVLGKTNTYEFAYGAWHPRRGYSRNPWDPARTAGATSGGSAAAVAAGLCTAAVGTDAGGSVRVPAAFCGIVGIKPTFGAIDLAGAFPSCWSLDHGGAMGRSVACAAAMIGAMAGRSMVAPSRDRLRLGVIADLAEHACVDPGVRAALADAFAALRDRGAVIEPVSLPLVLGANDAMMDLLYPEIWVIHEGRLATDRADYAPATIAEMLPGLGVRAVAYVKARRYQDALAAAIAGALDRGPYDALLTPTAPWPSPPRMFAINDEAMMAEGIATAPFSVAGVPVVTLPCGAADGLPIGLQVVGRRGGDGDVVAAAAAIERALPFRRPPGYEAP